MDVNGRRAGVKARVVAAGSVWESRMKLDEVKGGIKVFNGEEGLPQENAEINTEKKSVKRISTATASTVASSGKRKTWKAESFDGTIQIARGKTEPIKNCEEQLRELSVSADGIKRSPIQTKKGSRSEGAKELSMSVDGIVKTPIKKGRSDVAVNANEKSPSSIRKSRSDNIKEIADSGEQLRKVKSESVKVSNQSAKDSVIERNSVELSESKLEPDKVLDETVKSGDESVDEVEKNPVEIEENGSEESCKEFGVCQENVISSSEVNEETVKLPYKQLLNNDDDGNHSDAVIDGDDEFEGEEEEEEDVDEEIEIEIEKKSLDIKEINIPEEKPKKVETNVAEQKPKKAEINIAEQKPKKVEINIAEQKPKKTVNEETKVHQFRNRTAPSSSTFNKQPPPVLRRATIYQNLAKATPAVPVANERQSFPETHRHSKLQNLVDLVMWRDISRSAFVFGIGTFIIISSSYTKDLNVSLISVMSYLSLVYLAAIFLYRSLICRGVIDLDDDGSYVLGEDEAIWLLKLVLPYLNEFLSKIRALFSGDPATTMKMAVLLFVFARCGNSITIWKMAKLGFFGVFIIPKVCSSYSSQLTGYAKFWIQRFRDMWDSCSHKKAVALAIFSLVWNLSSMVARVWAVFMMFVAVRYYQQTIEREDWTEDDVGVDETWQEHTGGQRQGGDPISVEVNKVKKGY